MNEIRKKAFTNSFLTSLYIVGVGLFFYYGSLIKIGKNNVFLAPIALLFLFVFSASITGFLMLGKPLQMYLDDKKKDAVSLLSYTLLFFSGFTFLAIILLILFTK